MGEIGLVVEQDPVQGPEAPELIAGEEDLLRLFVGGHRLRPVHKRDVVEGKGLSPSGAARTPSRIPQNEESRGMAWAVARISARGATRRRRGRAPEWSGSMWLTTT
ncbi:TPA: hypothetical protein DCY65_05485 [Candidatus Acetothermia bacterium]|nr:hypothetical protein [Candidatus Acetothermia bacterium]